MFLTCPVFFPTRSPASQRKPLRGSKTLFGTLVVLHPKSASRRRVPVVTANVMSPHAFVCLYALFIAFFFPSLSLVAENLALRLADACIHQCSTCVRSPRRGSLCGRHSSSACMDNPDRHTYVLIALRTFFYLRSLRSFRSQIDMEEIFFKDVGFNAPLQQKAMLAQVCKLLDTFSYTRLLGQKGADCKCYVLIGPLGHKCSVLIIIKL